MGAWDIQEAATVVSQLHRWNTAPMAGKPRKPAMMIPHQALVTLTKSVEREKEGVRKNSLNITKRVLLGICRGPVLPASLNLYLFSDQNG